MKKALNMGLDYLGFQASFGGSLKISFMENICYFLGQAAALTGGCPIRNAEGRRKRESWVQMLLLGDRVFNPGAGGSSWHFSEADNILEHQHGALCEGKSLERTTAYANPSAMLIGWLELQWCRRGEYWKSKGKLYRAILSSLARHLLPSSVCALTSLWALGKSFGMHKQNPSSYQLKG